MKSYLLTLGLLSLGQSSLAQTGADILMNELSGGKSTIKIENPKAQEEQIEVVAPKRSTQVKVNLENPLYRALFTQMENQVDTPLDVRRWADFIYLGDYAQAAHLWTTIQPQIPSAIFHTATAGHLYSLWNLDLSQTFFDMWIRQISDPEFSKNPGAQALEAFVTKDFEQWMINHGLVVTPEHLSMVENLGDKKAFTRILKSWTRLRDKNKAEETLAATPSASRLILPLAQTAVLARVLKNDLPGAARILKQYVEPGIQAKKETELLASHYIQIARLLYKAGQLSAALDFYKKIPNQSRLYYEAREEMAWAMLRKGETSQLRGELASMIETRPSSDFAPELYLVKSITDLKMCLYSEVEKDMKSFTEQNGAWAAKIDAALAAPIPPAPEKSDYFIQLANQSVKTIIGEKDSLNRLAEQSINASLPAVGKQKHWLDYSVKLDSALEIAKKQQMEEFRRVWKNQKSALSEVIKKMKFVKLEYLNQVKGGVAAPSANLNKPAKEVIQVSTDKLVFPTSTELWPDELFKLQSAAQSQCLSKKEQM